MILLKPRREREFIIVRSMIRMFCANKHGSGSSLCNSCNQLERYAAKKLDNCKFGENKPVCKDCKIHCYSPNEKESMRQVMRWAGPRMIYLHPFFAIIHLIDSGKSSKTHSR
jgi:hypothetical protein